MLDKDEYQFIVCTLNIKQTKKIWYLIKGKFRLFH